jgi:hypothetical protein
MPKRPLLLILAVDTPPVARRSFRLHPAL